LGAKKAREVCTKAVRWVFLFCSLLAHSHEVLDWHTETDTEGATTQKSYRMNDGHFLSQFKPSNYRMTMQMKVGKSLEGVEKRLRIV
jgi:hypothetical protein